MLPVPEFPEWAWDFFSPYRFKAPHGGRGSSKSWTAASVAIQIALKPALLWNKENKALWEKENEIEVSDAEWYRTKARFLCAREFQNSIAESVHHLLVNTIDRAGLTPFFQVTNASITCIVNGSEFIFSGVRNNVTKIKSMEDIDICWLEEADKVSDNSWEVVIPTIRKVGSEIWATFNPDQESDPTYQRLIIQPPPSCWAPKVNWRENPWFNATLKKAKDYLFKVDPEAAEHVWEGACNTRSNAVIFRGKYVSYDFTPVSGSDFDEENWLGPYYGGDWGFSVDPTTLMKLWISSPKSGEKKLYIEKESWEVGLELDDIAPRWLKDIPECATGTIRADCSRPETISHVSNAGLDVIACEKWTGSVEDGIEFLRSFEEIVIHPRCEHQLEEARLYKYKVDKLTSDVLTDIVDKHNHCWDADRYALDQAIKKTRSIYDLL